MLLGLSPLAARRAILLSGREKGVSCLPYSVVGWRSVLIGGKSLDDTWRMGGG